MKQKYEYYTITLTAKSPIFVGDGSQLSKKEYIFDGKTKKVIIPKFDKLYQEIQRRGLENQFQEYMLNNRKVTLGEWLLHNRFSEGDYAKWTKYELDCGDAIIDKGKTLEVRTFTKDVYGKPYIPGSSLKGMFRTLLLAHDIDADLNKYNRMSHSISYNSKQRANRKYYLSDDIRDVEVERFHLLEKDKKNRSKMTNDIMSSVIVSDSVPLNITDLVLCQKIDVHTDGNSKKINLLRECLKPETEIQFELKIDKETGITEQLIIDAVKSFGDMYYNVYLNKFGIDRPKNNVVWIGGGTGFITKTIIYSMFPKEQGVKVADDILKCTLSEKIYDKHKHSMNLRKGIAPHVVKMTRYKGKLYQMGMAEVKVDKITENV